MTTYATSPSAQQPVGLDGYTLWLGNAHVRVDRYIPSLAQAEQPPVVFLHGWGMAQAGYRDGLEAMAALGAQVHAFSLPGYGGSTPLPARRCGVDAHAEHLSRALELAGFDSPVHLTGHSFGGAIALKMAANSPGAVSRVTAVCPAGGAGDGAAPWHGLIGAFLRDGGHAGLMQFARSFGPAVRRNALSVALSGLAARRADVVADLGQAVVRGVEAHVIIADRDAIVPPGPLARQDSGARISVVGGAHNWPHVEPSAWAALTLAS